MWVVPQTHLDIAGKITNAMTKNMCDARLVYKSVFGEL